MKKERRLAEKLLREKVCQEAQEMIDGAYRATRQRYDYTRLGQTGTKGGTIRPFPQSQINLTIEMLPIFEEVLTKELKRRIGKKLPEEIMTVAALMLVYGAEHMHWEDPPPIGPWNWAASTLRPWGRASAM